MTVSSEVRKAGPFTGNGVADTFPFVFKVFSASDIRVVRRGVDGAEADLVLDESYAVTLNEDQNAEPGGEVTLNDPLATDFTLVVTSSIGYLQPTGLTNQGGFYPRVISDALDRLTIQAQQIKEQVDRSAKVPITSADDPAGLADAIVALAAYADDIPALAADAQTALTSAATATTQAGIATTKAGEASDSADAAEADRILAQSAKTDAEAAQGIAEAQATIATTKAGEAAASAAAALLSENAGAVSAAAAELARDAAQAGANVYASTAAGLAAVADGAQFMVVSGNEIIRYTRTNSTTATEVARFYAKAYFDALFDASDYGASGYAWGVIDSAGNVAIGVKSDGSIALGDQTDVASAIPGAAIASQHFEARADGSGYAFAIADSNDNLAFAVLADGSVLVLGKAVAPQSQVDTLNDTVLGIETIVCWGDSLTEGSGSTGGLTYPAQLGTLLGANPINEGFGSQNAAQITARQGGNAAMVTVSGNQIPTSGAVAVTLDMNLLQYPVAATLSIYGYLGGIFGTLTKDSSNNYTFTRAVAGDATKVAPATPFIVTRSTRNTASIDLDQAINVIWAGSNDVGTAGMASVQANVEKCIAKLTPSRGRFVILSPIPNSAYTVGAAAHTEMRAVTDALKAKWPRNVIDVHHLMVENYNPAVPQDVTDYANKVVPSSLRSDAIHLNNAGYAVVAAAVASHITSRGWLA